MKRSLTILSFSIAMFCLLLQFPIVVWADTWLWPVPSSHTLSRGYGYDENGVLHEGIDIIGALDAPIVAAKSGTVCRVVHGDIPNVYIGGGNAVVIDHGNGLYSHYAHLNSTAVSEGQYVNAGTVIGYMGRTGNATGVHLHFAIANNSYGGGGRINNNTDQINYGDGNGYLDVNGLLDGTNNSSLGEFGTCDVYINGSLVANDIYDFYQEYAGGTSYRIDDIKAKNGYSYDGIVSGSLSGTVPSGGTADVRLKFSSCRLDVNGLLDGKQSGKTGSHGTFDVYLNGTRVADDVNDYYELVTKGSSYEIKDVKANDGYSYVPASNTGSLTGTIGSGKTVVSLAFNTVVEAGAEWTEMDFLPANITPETCEIEYNNHYKKTATTSPGTGWVKTGTGTTTYVNSGSVYDSDFELSTSQTRVFVNAYYYHYCGASTGDNVEHYNDGSHTDYHVAGDERYFEVTGGPWADDTDSRYTAYRISWRDGEWKGQPANCVAHRSSVYYKRYQYQDKKAVTDYIWEKNSGWQSTKDSSANSVTYRFRLKDTEKPVIQSAEVTGITPSGYTVTCRAADNIGITRAVVTSWTDNEDENNPAVQEIVPETSGSTCEFTVTIPISDHGSQYDTWYNTKICVYDKVGNTDEYAGENVRAYVPMVVHSSKRLQLPENLKEIEESAFEGSIAFGEAILPDGVETIGTRAFAECSRLVAVYMPDSVAHIAADSFADSQNVVLICESNNTAAAFARANGIPYITEE